MERLPKFCNKCGKELIANQTISEYDIYDGKPIELTVTLNCPDHERLFGKTNGHFHTVEEVTRSSTSI